MPDGEQFEHHVDLGRLLVTNTLVVVTLDWLLAANQILFCYCSWQPESCPFKMVSSILCPTIDDYLYLWVIVRGSCILWSVLICVASSHGLGNYPFLHVEDGWSGADDPPSVANMVPCFMS